MSRITQEKLTRLIDVLDRHGELAIAVSGGVDSLLLAHVAHAFAASAMTAAHAVSPAVPDAATARVKDHAQRSGWKLLLVDAAELADPDYRRNPVDRCFYCKSRLYACIRAATGLSIASGTNLDDLGDFRPGLEAARRNRVVHPFVEAGFAKADIYALAEHLELADLAALPAQPCLASRIETGIRVDAGALRFIETAEKTLSELLPRTGALRCRITGQGVYVECETLPAGTERKRAEGAIRTLCGENERRFAGFRPYRRGAAFLRSSDERV